MLSLKDPERLVLDLEDIEVTATLTGLAEKIGANDPYIKGMRVGRFKPGVIRVVFDLKSEIKPQVFTLAPVADYGHRLVLDLYPLEPPDPLLAFLDKLQAPREDTADPAAGAELQGPRARPRGRRRSARTSRASSSSHWMPATAARIPAPRAAAAPTRRT